MGQVIFGASSQTDDSDPSVRDSDHRHNLDQLARLTGVATRIDASRLRGEVLGAEYLGTTQIVVVRTGDGLVRARVPASDQVRTGETVGLTLSGAHLSLFDTASGRAIETALYEGARHG